MIYINYPSYSGTNWQGTLFVWAIDLVVYVCNKWGGSAMPVFQNLMLILHVFGFLTVGITSHMKDCFITDSCRRS